MFCVFPLTFTLTQLEFEKEEERDLKGKGLTSPQTLITKWEAVRVSEQLLSKTK